MSILDSHFGEFIGVGLFSESNSRIWSVCSSNRTTREMALAVTAFNIAGWIPAISTIIGIARVVLAFVIERPFDSKLTLITRGVIEIAQIGSAVLAPLDIGFSLARAVRVYLKNRAQGTL